MISQPLQIPPFFFCKWFLIALLTSLAVKADPSSWDTRSTADTSPPESNGGEDENAEWTRFQHFLANNETMTCSADEHARPFNNQIRGVNLGGWMVLEPWITPSLFYQFLTGREGTAAFDTYTFCEVLGAEEANEQLRNHWDKWVTEDIIAQLARSGAVNSLRLPVGDYMYKPYGPYVGCFDGALKYVDSLLDWAYSNGLSVLFDIHTMRDSQNGFDNSGKAMGFQWTSALRCVLVFVASFCYCNLCYHVADRPRHSIHPLPRL